MHEWSHAIQTISYKIRDLLEHQYMFSGAFSMNSWIHVAKLFEAIASVSFLLATVIDADAGIL